MGILELFFIILILCIFSMFARSDNVSITIGSTNCFPIERKIGKGIEHNNDTNMIVHKGDITKINIECIVNASNPSGLGCNIPNHCVDSAIHSAAGPELLEECKKLNGIPTGTAKITKGYKLPAKYVIHTTGPQMTNNDKNYDWNLLSKCYSAVLDVAKNNNIKEVAFCCISTGLYGYPKNASAKVAHDTIKKWIDNNNYKFKKIVFVTFTNDDYEAYKKIL